MNTILITVDALRPDHLQQFGGERDVMPAINRLIDEGTKFQNAFANGPYTRVSIPALHSSNRLAHSNPEEVSTISGLLKQEDIKTGCVGTRTGFKSVEGDLHFEDYITLGRDEYYDESHGVLSSIENKLVRVANNALESFPRVRRFAKFLYESAPYTTPGFNFKGYTSAKDVTDASINWIQDNRNQDFFLWIHYMEGHRPYGVHDSDPAFTEYLSNDEIRNLMKKAGTMPEKVTAEERELLIDLYDSDLRYCSTHLDRLFDVLQHSGLWENTNIVFTSDHGEEFYDHGQYFHRNLPYDELLHVPLVLRTPDGEESVETDSRELIDIAPTILDFHDIGIPNEFEGENLYSGDSREVLASGSQMVDGPVVACRWDGYKYIHANSEDYLFDLKEDAREEFNVADKMMDEVERFKSIVPDRYLSDATNESLREPEDEVDKGQLEALGYLEINE